MNKYDLWNSIMANMASQGVSNVQSSTYSGGVDCDITFTSPEDEKFVITIHYHESSGILYIQRFENQNYRIPMSVCESTDVDVIVLQILSVYEVRLEARMATTNPSGLPNINISFEGLTPSQVRKMMTIVMDG